VMARNSPIAMRRLSFTLDGWLKSHSANPTMMIGKPKATRPNSPPKVHASSCTATVLPIRNHSTIAPRIASSTSSNGTPSRRSAGSNGSVRNMRAAPPTPCAMPRHARTTTPSRGSGSASTRVFAVACALREDRVGVFSDFPRVEALLAISTRVRPRADIGQMTLRSYPDSTAQPPLQGPRLAPSQATNDLLHKRQTLSPHPVTGARTIPRAREQIFVGRPALFESRDAVVDKATEVIAFDAESLHLSDHMPLQRIIRSQPLADLVHAA